MAIPDDVFKKDPDSVLDYLIDWRALTNGTGEEDWLEADETIASQTVTADKVGITIDSVDLTDSNSSITVWLSGGTLDESYRITNHIITTAGREEDRTITIRMKEK